MPLEPLHSPLNYVLFKTDARTSHSGRAAPAPRTHRTHCSSLPSQCCHRRPALQRSRGWRGGEVGGGGKRAPGGSSIMLVNALSSTKFHQSSPTHRSKTILLCAFLFSSMYMPPTNVHEIFARVMGALEAVRTSRQRCAVCTGLRARAPGHLVGCTERLRCFWACVSMNHSSLVFSLACLHGLFFIFFFLLKIEV